jgi:hypothetical protein
MLGAAVVKMFSPCVCAPLPLTVRLTHMNWSEYVLETSVLVRNRVSMCARSKKCRRIISAVKEDKLNSA